MFRNLGTLIAKDFIVILRHRKALIASLCLPVMVFLLLAFSFSGLMHREADITPMNIALVDEEDSVLSRMLLNSFKDNKAFSGLVNMEKKSREEADGLFKNGNLTAIIEIPKDFSKSLIYLDNYPLSVKLNPKEPLKSSILKNMLEGYGKYISAVETNVVALQDVLKQHKVPPEVMEDVNEKISVELILTALSRSSFFKFSSFEDIPSTTSVEYFAVAMVVLMLMYTSINAGNFIIKERKSGCFFRIMASPTDCSVYLLGKLIVFSAYNSAAALLLVLPVTYISGFGNSYLTENLAVYIFTAGTLVVSLSILGSTVFQSEEVFVLAGNISAFIGGILGGCFLPLQLMPLSIQSISKITPQYWIIKGAVYLINYYPLSSIYGIMFIFWTLIILINLLTFLRLVRLS